MIDKMMSDYQAGRYARIHDRVSVAMRHHSKPCLGIECDQDSPCKRHERTAELAFRVVRMRERHR